MTDEERLDWMRACWSDKCLAITEHMRLYYAVGEMMDVLGMHGTICARDDRVQAVMDALHKIDGGNRMVPNDRVEGRDAASSRRVPSHDGLCLDGGAE